MQIKITEYDALKHDVFRALSVKQPFANDLVNIAYEDDDGNSYGFKSIEVRSRCTSYRGKLLICSSQSPKIPNMQSGCALGFVEVYGVKRVKDFTDEDWDNTRIPRARRSEIKSGWGWLMRNPKRVVELPIKGQLGIFNIAFEKGDIVEYPRIVKVGRDDFNLLNKEKR
ncbi:hypothetical protein [Hoylesella shahii]|jgi:hypothetical protein|uniref:hypothetical protein n=1 Tax=Hoylesella shahii TaxID=228603 RepID=UPI002067E2AE|nr:hypothetical protein [Hoylesella shahii]DAV47213.1 MAG TPA: ASCH domain protein [Caudoviricetes sp.]